MDVPAPLEWHPYYRRPEFMWLLDWLHFVPGYPRDVVEVPYMVHERGMETTGGPDLRLRTRRLVRVRCAGPAPFVGRPFYYEWFAARDEHGRWVAGESSIDYFGDWYERERRLA